MPTHRKGLSVATLICLCVSFLLASAADKKHKILSTIFDGVPTPEAQAAAKASKKKKNEANAPQPAPGAAELKAAVAAVTTEKPRPAIEKLGTWEEVLKSLPLDVVGGPDWVKAIKDGTIAPRHVLPSDGPPVAPFTLDNLVAGAGGEASPALDMNVVFTSKTAPFYKAVFPHSSHTLWLNCSSCHPGIVAQRGSGMQKILAGEYCGRCHGRVSFSPLSGCARCHENLKPAATEVMEADLAKAAREPVVASPETIERGKSVYLEACAACHGERGDGNGPLAPALSPKPRNFTVGKFKFRSTNSSSLPTDFDLFRTITRGIPGTSMPGFSSLSYADRVAIVNYLKTLSDKFAKQKPGTPITIPDPPPLTPALMEMGKKFFKDAECFKCHGEQGRGDGPSSVGMKDDWGEPLRPFDFTSGHPKSGSSLKDYYRDVMTGLQGTPMPDFGDIFEPEEAWGVVYFVRSLGDAKRQLPPAVKGDILFTRKSEPVAAANQIASATAAPDASDSAVGLPRLSELENVAPAVFPHWFHRMRVRCSVCHSSIFEMKAGANPITMDAIRAGKFCGTCHPSYPDGKSLAWPVTFESCARCHVTR